MRTFHVRQPYDWGVISRRPRVYVTDLWLLWGPWNTSCHVYIRATENRLRTHRLACQSGKCAMLTTKKTAHYIYRPIPFLCLTLYCCFPETAVASYISNAIDPQKKHFIGWPNQFCFTNSVQAIHWIPFSINWYILASCRLLSQLSKNCRFWVKNLYFCWFIFFKQWCRLKQLCGYISYVEVA